MKIKAEVLKVAIANKGWRIKDLVEESGLSHHTISKILNHNSQHNLYTIGKIAKALNMPIEELTEE